MIKFYCDRCGKEIEDAQIGLIHHHVHFGELMFSSMRASKEELTAERYICPDCETSFIRWYNHPEVEEKDE